MAFKVFVLFLALAALFVQRSGTILAIYVEGHRRNISVVAWLFLGLTALLDSILVYIGPSPKEGEKEKRKDR